jgi:hypothetical protein
MTPKIRAENIILGYLKLQDFKSYNWFDKILAKKCAVLAVDQVILESCKNSEFRDPRNQDERINYWNEVKKEIEKL